MRAIFSGDRHWNDTKILKWLIQGLNENQLGLVVIEGECPTGLDVQARVVAQFYKIPVEPTPAEWKKFGKAAGPIRNGKMITERNGKIVFAFHDALEESSGTLDMVTQAIAHNIPVYLVGHVNLERLKEIERWKGFRMSWWWIEGQRKRKSADGKRAWIPLYSAPDEAHGKAILRMILNDDPSRHEIEGIGKEKTNSKARSKEAVMLSKEFRDFRLVPPAAILKPSKRQVAAREAVSQRSGASSVATCPKCGSVFVTKVRKGEKRRWKCSDCGKRWPRDTPTSPQETSNGSSGSPATPKRPRRRTEA